MGLKKKLQNIFALCTAAYHMSTSQSVGEYWIVIFALNLIGNILCLWIAHFLKCILI